MLGGDRGANRAQAGGEAPALGTTLVPRASSRADDSADADAAGAAEAVVPGTDREITGARPVSGDGVEPAGGSVGERVASGELPFGARVLGHPREPGPVVARRVETLLTLVTVAANVVGALIVFVLATWVLPGVGGAPEGRHVPLVVAVPAYVGVAILVGVIWGTVWLRPQLRWVLDDRAPDADEQRAALRAPNHLVRIQAVLWAVGAVGFTLNALVGDPRQAVAIALTVTFGGAVTAAFVILLGELALRPLAARALATGPPADVHVPGIRARGVFAWGLGSAVPVVGLMLTAVFGLVEEHTTAAQLAVTMLVLGGLTLVVGLLMTLLAARATVDPVLAVRASMAQVERGDLDVHVAVYDATEIGQLQVGFNRMVDGLQERERIREMFGRHVGEEVARVALGHEVGPDGELRDIAVIFVDVVGSTRLAATCPPTEVLRLLNRYFTVVVDAVEAHGGFVNKFEGDGALAVFGAPDDLDDAAGRALAAARDLAARLPADVPELVAGIAVAAGPAVAGYLGSDRRLEYTVLGDPVNEAARLTELAKAEPGRVVASMVAVERAAPAEARRWQPCGEVHLRGRLQPTRLARPA